jgi:hypothetical protein
LREYINIGGVFQSKDGGRTLAIRNLTGAGAERILEERGMGNIRADLLCQ